MFPSSLHTNFHTVPEQRVWRGACVGCMLLMTGAVREEVSEVSEVVGCSAVATVPDCPSVQKKTSFTTLKTSFTTTLAAELVSEVRGQSTNCFHCLLGEAAEACLYSSTVFKNVTSFLADAVKSSEDEEDDESSSEENKLSSELSTSNEKLQRKPQTFVVSFSFWALCVENMNQWKHKMIVIMMFISSCLLVSIGASVGDAREDGEAAPRRSCQQDCQVSMPSDWKSCSHPALVQERKRVQKRPKNWRL